MKPLLMLILFLCITLTAFGQQPEYPDSGFTNKAEAKNLIVDGKKEGKWIEYIHRSDTGIFIVSEINANYYRLIVYKADTPNGIVRDYNKKTGKLAIETPYTNGIENGIEKWYYDNGKIWIEVPVFEDRNNGVEKTYNENGTIFTETPYVNGIRNGLKKLYYRNGRVEYEFSYVGGQCDTVKSYRRNGTLKNACPWATGDGKIQRDYYRNGKMKLEYSYTGFKKNGAWKYYRRNGKLKTEINYTNGVKGVKKYFDENGNEIKK